MPWRTLVLDGLKRALKVPKALRYPVNITGLILIGVVVWLAGRMLYEAEISGDVILLICILFTVGLTLLAAGRANGGK